MLTFKEFMIETVIKLRGFNHGPDSASSNSDKFMRDLHSTSTQHFANDKARVIGKAHVHVSNSRGQIHIHDIQSHEQGSGAGTHALKHLTGLADKHGVNLTLHAKGYGSTKSSQLKTWYTKHGFAANEPRSADMTRKPS